MPSLLEYVGCVHIYLGPYRGNPIALYLKRSDHGCRIGPKAYPWNDVVGIGETPNKAAADFEEKWKGKGLTADLYRDLHGKEGLSLKSPRRLNLLLHQTGGGSTVSNSRAWFDFPAFHLSEACSTGAGQPIPSNGCARSAKNETCFAARYPRVFF